MRRVLLIVAALASAGSLVTTAWAGAAERASLPDIEDEVMCPICGTTLELSQAPQAERERELIRRLIDEGRSKEEIKDALVAEYGEDVLAVPDSGGFDLSAWIVPAAGLAVAALGVLISVARWRRRRDQMSDPASEPTNGEKERLEADLSAFDR